MGGFTVSLPCVACYLLLHVLFLPHLLGFALFPELTEKIQGRFLTVFRADMTKNILDQLFRPNQFFFKALLALPGIFHLGLPIAGDV